MTLRGKMARGAAWMIGARFAIKSLGIVSTLILVRLLLPADFGLVALATAFVAGLELIKMFGFDVALIQDQNASADKFNTAWTVNLGFSLALAAALLLLAAPAAEFYSDGRLRPILYALSFSMVVQGFENNGVVNFRKDLEFHKEFKFLLIQKLVGFCVTIPLAFVLRNYWALVAGIIASSITGTISSYAMHPFRPRIGRKGASELFHFSKWLVLNNALYFVRHRAADFILGKFGGPKVVGLYSVSYEISHMVTAELVAPINRAVFPGYSKMANDIDDLRLAYLQVMSLIAILSIPAATGIAATADLLVPVMLGSNWMAAIPLIQILAFSGAIAILETNIGAAYLALGRPQILTLVYSFFAATFVFFLFLLVPRFGPMGAAQASLLAGLANIPLQIYLMRRTLGINFKDLAGVFFRPIAASAGMFWIVRIVAGEYSVADETAVQIPLLALVVCAGIFTYIGINAVLWIFSGRPVGAETYVMTRVKEIRNR